MKFYSATNLERPIKPTEETRQFAFESLNRKYGNDTMENMSVPMDLVAGHDYRAHGVVFETWK